MARPDLVVMGAGVWGLSIAWEAARRGARVRMVERQGIGAGASGGVVGALMPHAPARWDAQKQAQFDSLILSRSWWAEVAAASSLPTGYGATGRLQPLADPAAGQAAAEGAARHWRGLAAMQAEPAPAGWGPAGAMVLRDTLSARLRPAAALAALAGALRAAGGEVTAGEAPPEGAAPVVWATGAAGLAMLADARGRPADVPVKGQAAVLAFDAGPQAPQVYADGLHIVPHDDGTVAVGSTSETAFADPFATDALLDDVIARARMAVPALADAPVIRRWAGLRPRAATRRPLVGPFPGRPGQFVALGGFKTGFGLAPLVAGLVAGLVLDGAADLPEGWGTDTLTPA